VSSVGLIKSELENYARNTATTLRRNLQYYFVCCPFHHEKTPSCKVNLQHPKYPAGDFKCYGCGRYGDWADFSSAGNLKGLTFTENYSEFGTLRKTKTELTEAYDSNMALPWSRRYGDWRTISNATLRRVEGKRVFSYAFDDSALYLPCMCLGEHVGGITARLGKDPDGGISYLNTGGSWVLHSLYPYDHVSIMLTELDLDYVVLVEGPRDALRLIDNGIPALAVLGVESWSETKADLIYALGISQVLKFTDGDAAGTRLSRYIYESLDLPNIKVKVAFGEDPANCSIAKLNAIKNRYH